MEWLSLGYQLMGSNEVAELGLVGHLASCILHLGSWG
jgi:hypothetical protein